MKSSKILFKIHSNTAVITLNNSKILNAWDSEMRNKICEIVNTCNKNKLVKSIIITGSGTRGFCSGQDLNEITNKINTKIWIQSFKKVYYAIRSIEKPIIAAVNGVAAGSGFQLALLADFIITHKRARFGQVEINNGIASVTGPAIMKIFLGMSKTIELTLTGELIDGTEANKLGFIYKLTSKKKVYSESLKIAKELESKSPTAMMLTKRNFWFMIKKDLDKEFKQAEKIHKISFKSKAPQTLSQKFLNS